MLADSDVVPGYMQSPEQLQQLRRKAAGEAEPELRHKTFSSMLPLNKKRPLIEKETQLLVFVLRVHPNQSQRENVM
jgi:hypothetical protein